MVIEDVKSYKVPTANMTGYRCLRCNHTWIPHVKNSVPELCPKCKSARWHTARKKKG